jgi:hypothetical protein
LPLESQDFFAVEEWMVKTIKAAFGFLFTSLLAGCCNPANIGSVPVTLNGQLQTNWCWAASGQMTMNYLHPASNVQQCDEANKEFGRSDCCNASVPSACNNGGWPEYGKYSFTANTTSDAPLTWAQIQSQIYCAKKPFAFSWHWNGGGGHMMVATGYVTIGGTNYVSVNNPWPPTGGVQEIYTYDKYVGGSGWDHSHWNDYYNITYTGGQ